MKKVSMRFTCSREPSSNKPDSQLSASSCKFIVKEDCMDSELNTSNFSGFYIYNIGHFKIKRLSNLFLMTDPDGIKRIGQRPAAISYTTRCIDWKKVT